MFEKIESLTKKRFWPLMISSGSAICMLFAFFIPSIQDQWDRYQSRKIIQQYVAIGEDFNKEQNFIMAEQAFAKAFELSEQKRLDIEMMRLHAKINLIYIDPLWGSEPPAGLEEVDFQFLLHLQRAHGDETERASILTSYGIFLASKNHYENAEKQFHEAIALNPKETFAYINLGNLLDQTGKKADAELAYKKAVEIDASNARAHYNLGLLFADEGRSSEAEKEFQATLQIDPHEADAKKQLHLIRQQIPAEKN